MMYPDVQKIISVLENIEAGKGGRGFNIDRAHYPEDPDDGIAVCTGSHAAFTLGDLSLNPEEALSTLCNIPLEDAHDLCWPGLWLSPETGTYSIIGCRDVTVSEVISHLESYMVSGKVDWTPYEEKTDHESAVSSLGYNPEGGWRNEASRRR